ncbi:glycosyltransferase family 2 protein [Prevotella brevis]|uniref:Glycosyltransferase family 2 protein n=1 Tax=Xylanibacter brevis TaxID=83231 RepID=A0ABS9CIT8_9BACT|nr:glycosyltransferase family A protein [Xylanibacter brevis]MCF2564198.1 glycosyltransferase family 2 protein [Xylanibacter brevis]
MGLKIVVLTPTYNRGGDLSNLYRSLCDQENKQFSWVIVDDGSPESVDSIVEAMRLNADYPIIFYKKNNGGKSSAINYALDKFEKDVFLIIIDDDEILHKDAINIVTKYANQYKDSNVGMIDFNRAYSDGTIIGNPIFNDDYMMTVQERRKKGIFSDGYTGYYMSKLGDTRFPIFEGERYIGPSVLSMLISMQYSILWTQPVLGHTEYLDGGLTRQGRKLRVKNPRSMAYYCMLMQSPDSGFKYRFTYAVLYSAYLYYANIKKFNPGINYDLCLPIITRPLGLLLSKYWRFKFRNRK